MKRYIDVTEYAGQILAGVAKGALVTTCAGGKCNTMSVSWGTLGIEWGRKIFTVFIRENRHTRSMLDESMEFTVSLPLDRDVREIIGYCGTHSGRDTDKFAALGLTAIPADTVAPPAIGQLPLTLECKAIYRQPQDPEAIPEQIRRSSYPQDVPGTACGANRDYHTAYYGLITAAYIVE